MSSRKPPKYVSCTRCQSKKTRCNRVQPRCDKCEAINAECIYVPRKARAKKQSNPSEKDLLLDILRRLERLEDHCKINPDSEGHGVASSSISVSSDFTRSRPASIDLLHSSQPRTPNTQSVVHSMLNGIKDDRARSLLSSNVFCHLRNVESRLFENETCVKAVEAAMAEVERLESAREVNVLDPPAITKEMAKRWVKSYYEVYQFEGFRVPLEKSFVMSIPDLLEIPHVQLDSTSQIIYHNVLLQGIMLDSEYLPGRGKIIQYLYQSSMTLLDDWLCHIENTLPDMFAAFLMISMTLEGCNSEMAWKIFGYACNIARALGFFSVDEPSDGQNSQSGHHHSNSESEVDKNRKRFEFWHLLRMDCLFRLSFGKPALIPGGSWTVNFPDPTITGIDDASTRFIQIHFLASMRLTLTLLKYLDLVGVEMHQDTDVYDQALDGLIAEVQTIMSDWNAEELVSSATNHVDTWFVVDILFSSYKMLIVFTQSKRCNQNSQFLPRHTVDVARKSLRMFQSLMSSVLHAYWGISLILMHQFIPFFILCAEIIGSHRYNELEDDFILVSWLNDFVDKAAEERPELRPIAAIAKAMTIACQQVQFPAS